MATKVHMEALSPTMEEGRLVKWLKREGDPVTTGDTLAEVETDKAIMELVARADGNLIKVLVAEGATVPVGDAVAYIGALGESVQDGSGERGAAPSAAKEPAGAPGAPLSVPLSTPHSPSTDRPKASPLARRVAAERGVDLQLVAGSGPGGRVVLRDIEKAGSGERGVVPAGAPPAARPRIEPLPTPHAPSPAALPRTGAPFDDVPLTQIRKTIARRLSSSLGPVPHFFLTADVDMERAAEARDALNRRLEEGTPKVSFNDIILKATALALRRHRACNAWFQDDHVRYWNQVHLGMAVAIDDGLITPVIRDADAKSLGEIGAEARELAQRARARRLKPDQYTGSTFSVSNLGMFEIDHFTAVINPPEAGILAVGTIEPRVVPAAEGGTAVRHRMRVTMSCDHRVIDGATGAAFLKTLKGMLENPLAML
jgi:pyruvate dehydrogenase E2 component (dihydrolipoamide acetyltransferase)